MYIYLAAKRRMGTRVYMWWWYKKGMELVGMWTAAWEAEQGER